MRSRSLDYTALTGRVGLRGRLRTAAGDNLLVMGMTAGVLLTAAASAVFIVQLASGKVGGFGWFCLAFLLPCGVWAMTSGLLQAGKGGAVAAFARANDLQLTTSVMARSYAGSQFADGSHLVRQSVRTRGAAFIEVGDRWPVTAPKVSTNQATDTVQATPHQASLFLRVRLSGQVGPRPRRSERITPELDEGLRRFAGAYAVEVSGREVTVFGSLPLRATQGDRMAQAIALADTLAEAFGAAEGAGVVVSDEPVSEERERDGRPLGSMKVIGVMVALLVIGPVVIALVMSAFGDLLRGRDALAKVVVLAVVAVVMAVIAVVVRRATTPRRRRKS